MECQTQLWYLIIILPLRHRQVDCLFFCLIVHRLQVHTEHWYPPPPHYIYMNHNSYTASYLEYNNLASQGSSLILSVYKVKRYNLGRDRKDAARNGFLSGYMNQVKSPTTTASLRSGNVIA